MHCAGGGVYSGGGGGLGVPASGPRGVCSRGVPASGPGGGVPASGPGGSAPGGSLPLVLGVSASGRGCVSQRAMGQTPPVDRITDTCKNITFANFVCGR